MWKTSWRAGEIRQQPDRTYGLLKNEEQDGCRATTAADHFSKVDVVPQQLQHAWCFFSSCGTGWMPCHNSCMQHTMLHRAQQGGCRATAAEADFAFFVIKHNIFVLCARVTHCVYYLVCSSGLVLETRYLRTARAGGPVSRRATYIPQVGGMRCTRLFT